MKNFDKNQKNPIFIQGDCFKILKEFDKKSIDCVITSPPYFREREKNKHFNLNQSIDSYLENILEFTSLIYEILKDEGSFWLNLGDTYSKTSLQLIPNRIAIKMIEEQGWILNNDVIWKKTSSTPTSYKKRLTSSYEHFYHFVKTNDFYYNLTTLNAKKNKPKVIGDVIKTSSNVTGVNYSKIIKESIHLNELEKVEAYSVLSECLEEVRTGEICDFRMLIRGNNKVSSKNRIDEINKKGFVVIKSKSNKPSDVWEILPEKSSIHYAPFPKDLVEFPIKVTCPPKGIVLDPFCGSGTTNVVAIRNNRKTIGIDINKDFIEYAENRCKKEI